MISQSYAVQWGSLDFDWANYFSASVTFSLLPVHSTRVFQWNAHINGEIITAI